MPRNVVAVTALIGFGLLSLSLSPQRSLAATEDTASLPDSVSAELQQQISQVLWGCYAVGEELVGVGDVQGAKDVLRKCYADDMQFEAILPPAYASFNFVTSNGADGFVDTSNQFYRALGLVYVQHLITNIVIKKTGANTAVVKSGALAVHTYADNHVFNANVGFVSDFKQTNGVWKITHTTMRVYSVTESPAWVPTAAPAIK